MGVIDARYGLLFLSILCGLGGLVLVLTLWAMCAVGGQYDERMEKLKDQNKDVQNA